MPALKSRISNLERCIGAAAGMMVVVSAGPDDAAIDALLAAKGVRRDDPAHSVIIFKTIYENREGGIDDQQRVAEIVYLERRP